MFCTEILCDAAAKHFTKRNATVFRPLAHTNVQHAPLGISIGYLHITYLAATKPAAITQPNDETVF